MVYNYESAVSHRRLYNPIINGSLAPPTPLSTPLSDHVNGHGDTRCQHATYTVMLRSPTLSLSKLRK